MQVREGMSEVVLTIGPDHTLRQAAEAMCRRNVGAAVVIDPEEQGPACSPSATSCVRSATARIPTPSMSATT